MPSTVRCKAVSEKLRNRRAHFETIWPASKPSDGLKPVLFSLCSLTYIVYYTHVHVYTIQYVYIYIHGIEHIHVQYMNVEYNVILTVDSPQLLQTIIHFCSLQVRGCLHISHTAAFVGPLATLTLLPLQ